MTRERAINSMISHGFTVEQVGEVIKAVTDKPTTKNNLEVQKAIEIIKADSLAPYSVNEILSARDLAVEALKQMTTTKNLGVDCISRQATINAVKRIHPIDTDYDCTLYDKVDVMYVLKDMPSVTPQPRKGKWISHGEHCENLGVMPSGLGAYEWCSNCDCGIDVREWHRNHYNYCPNCGADMREVEE
jgi:hypothetical protein